MAEANKCVHYRLNGPLITWLGGGVVLSTKAALALADGGPTDEVKVTFHQYDVRLVWWGGSARTPTSVGIELALHL